MCLYTTIRFLDVSNRPFRSLNWHVWDRCIQQYGWRYDFRLWIPFAVWHWLLQQTSVTAKMYPTPCGWPQCVRDCSEYHREFDLTRDCRQDEANYSRCEFIRGCLVSLSICIDERVCKLRCVNSKYFCAHAGPTTEGDFSTIRFQAWITSIDNFIAVFVCEIPNEWYTGGMYELGPATDTIRTAFNVYVFFMYISDVFHSAPYKTDREAHGRWAKNVSSCVIHNNQKYGWTSWSWLAASNEFKRWNAPSRTT